MTEVKNIKVSQLEINNGQLEGLPKNPRFIKDNKYKALVKSISDAPEMLALREILAYEYKPNKYIVIGGNMRLRACKELGYKELPCKILSADTPIEKLREYTIKDNNNFGQYDWDVMANEWAQEEVEAWGVEVDWAAPKTLDESDELRFPKDGVGSEAVAPVVQSEPEINTAALPPELQNIDLSPAPMADIKGDDQTLKDRIIIVFDKDKKAEIANILGLDVIDKVIYEWDEIPH